MARFIRIGSNKEFDREVTTAILGGLDKSSKPMSYTDIFEFLNRRNDLTRRLPLKLFVLDTNSKTSYVGGIIEYLESQELITSEESSKIKPFGISTGKIAFTITDKGRKILQHKDQMPVPTKIKESPKR